MICVVKIVEDLRIVKISRYVMVEIMKVVDMEERGLQC